ncbi:aminotransferase class I/II-fold pyridoxal phosphate-dependent enzyme [Gulosibacter molinativorax]|uniref:Aminotransferase n=1 Tax=Gulosibacter molinativorax TaxID=256821 RepID=A0ABT7C6B2_9MICO|nr:aminotransferase class I/II-fold pyridoxal phosphate-dependent enzyme [Gulosibacter molinativorax]MDJ1370347.1 aminotransferase class V-fold PLP-dependent enzyme [Gulosibacter molinativorax]QUY61260.1 Aspartate aminotransferase [Gulosibacter molinativorax]
MKISRRAIETEPFHALAFGQRASELQAEGHRVVKLSVGEPSFGAPAAAREAMREVMDGRPMPYTSSLGLPALREAIAGFYRDQHGVEVDPARIVITSGASSALLVVAAATIDPGDEVIMADPSYPSNRELVGAFGGRVVSVPTSAQTRFQLDARSVASAWTEMTTAIMIASPSNPAGTSVPFDELAEICRFAKDRDAWRIVDEIYLNLADPQPDGSPARTVLATDPDAIVINSFSKYFGMTGWRLGWAVLPEALLPALEWLAMNFFLSASAPIQQAALACFTEESLAEYERRRVELVERRQFVLEGLAEIGLPVPVPPDGAFYVYIDVSGTGLDSWTFCERVLEEVHVALTPGRDFGTVTADTHVRLSYAAEREELAEGIRRLGQFLTRLG